MEKNNLVTGEEIVRPCGYSNYPSIWDFEYVQSLTSQYSNPETEEMFRSRRDKVKDNIGIKLSKIVDPLVQLEHVDMLQRIGLSYQFENEIDHILKIIYNNDFCGRDSSVLKDNYLYATALKFRLLRQHHYQIPQDVLNKFMDERNKFKESTSKDVIGLLSLYEASFLLMKNEHILEEARDFSTKNLKEFVKLNKEENYILKLVTHALEVPLHWRVPRVEARWFIDLCIADKRSNIDPDILELAILDFNIVQSIHQQELKELYRWWKHTGLDELKYSRNRMVENMLWNTGMISEPQYEFCRKVSTKMFMFITIIDDTYDSYGTLSELELFTKAVESWDLNALDLLPDYMKMTFLALNNFVHEVGYDILKEQGFNTIKYQKHLWADLCKSYLLEAKWFFGRTIPSFKEYIENAWVSIATPLVLVIGYMCLSNPITHQTMQLLAMNGYPNIIRHSSMIGRLVNDLATNPFESEKGDVPTSIECYMNETGSSEDEARQYIKSLVDENWKELNRDRAENFSSFPRPFIDICANLHRMTMWFYDSRDGFGTEYKCTTRDCASLVLMNPIPYEVQVD